MSNNWHSIIGHQWAVQLLMGAIANGRPGHAYLITGPEQVGKTTLARTFAQALNCQAPSLNARPCGQCRPCQLISIDRHPDVRLVVPEMSGRGRLTLKIDAIRNLQHDLNLAAYETRYKVAILKDFDAATIGAANAFLKTLEEPPGNVMLLLTAKDADTLLPTITSRCRTVGLRPLSVRLIEESLQDRWHVAAEEARLLAHLSDGRLGWAVLASRDAALLAARQAQLERLYEALAGNRTIRFELANHMARKPEALPGELRSWLSWWRDITLISHQPAENGARTMTITNIDHQAYMERMARTWNRTEVVSSLKQTNLALWQLAHNANTRLVLENLLLTYPFPSTHFASPKEGIYDSTR
jgi:DNA polymerase-3 subunit delta'